MFGNSKTFASFPGKSGSPRGPRKPIESVRPLSPFSITSNPLNTTCPFQFNIRNYLISYAPSFSENVMEISPEGSFRGGFIPQKTCNSLITLPLIPILIIPRSNFVPILIRHGRRLHSPSTPWDFRADSRTKSNNWEQTGRT